jgi:hypothetical protein
MKISTKTIAENHGSVCYVARKWWVKNNAILMPGASSCCTGNSSTSSCGAVIKQYKAR